MCSIGLWEAMSRLWLDLMRCCCAWHKILESRVGVGLVKGLVKGYLHMLGLKVPVMWGNKMDGL